MQIETDATQERFCILFSGWPLISTVSSSSASNTISPEDAHVSLNSCNVIKGLFISVFLQCVRMCTNQGGTKLEKGARGLPCLFIKQIQKNKISALQTAWIKTSLKLQSGSANIAGVLVSAERVDLSWIMCWTGVKKTNRRERRVMTQRQSWCHCWEVGVRGGWS